MRLCVGQQRPLLPTRPFVVPPRAPRRWAAAGPPEAAAHFARPPGPTSRNPADVHSHGLTHPRAPAHRHTRAGRALCLCLRHSRTRSQVASAQRPARCLRCWRHGPASLHPRGDRSAQASAGGEAAAVDWGGGGLPAASPDPPVLLPYIWASWSSPTVVLKPSAATPAGAALAAASSPGSRPRRLFRLEVPRTGTLPLGFMKRTAEAPAGGGPGSSAPGGATTAGSPAAPADPATLGSAVAGTGGSSAAGGRVEDDAAPGSIGDSGSGSGALPRNMLITEEHMPRKVDCDCLAICGRRSWCSDRRQAGAAGGGALACGGDAPFAGAKCLRRAGVLQSRSWPHWPAAPPPHICRTMTSRASVSGLSAPHKPVVRCQDMRCRLALSISDLPFDANRERPPPPARKQDTWRARPRGPRAVDMNAPGEGHACDIEPRSLQAGLKICSARRPQEWTPLASSRSARGAWSARTPRPSWRRCLPSREPAPRAGFV